MARFDPNAYPDRLAFEAHAHRIRAEEIDKAFIATGRLAQCLAARNGQPPPQARDVGFRAFARAFDALTAISPPQADGGDRDAAGSPAERGHEYPRPFLSVVPKCRLRLAEGDLR